MRRLSVVLSLAALAAVAVVCSSAGAATTPPPTFSRGFVDDVWFDPPSDGITVNQWVANTQSTGARFVQVEVDWTSVEPNAPTGNESLTNPNAPEFSFGYLDTELKEFARTGLTPVFLVTDAPRWAEGPGGTADEYATGGFRPNATAFGNLGAAMAKRYSGHFRDPSHRHTLLPRVRFIQAWAEANMPNHLAPQWTRSNGRMVNTGVSIYRRMLNAFYAGVKSEDPSDVVLMTGLESYGDAPGQGQRRTHPVTFLQNLLCIDAHLRPTACPTPAHFDVLASDPYDIGPPTLSAVSPQDASAPDLGRLQRVVSAALTAHTLLPIRPKPTWVTEFGYDSDPPNPTKGTISAETQAIWLEESFYVFWKEGVSTELWYLIRDQTPPYSLNYFSGVYFRNGQPKPSYTAYRFPFVVMHRGTLAQIWGISPASGTVRIQVASGPSWNTVASIPATRDAIFQRLKPLPLGRYRAIVNGNTSLVWSYKRLKKHRSGGGGPVISLKLG
ncbi:MAG TPA: hypothetical protein VFN75_12365 [Pseudonocardiaceae bacterium]|nr:hypothetical protein [Pseudonocardiaceae bacterium]